MKNLAKVICALSVLFLAACGGDSGEDATTAADNATPTESNMEARGNESVRSAVATNEKKKTNNAYSGFDIAGIYLGMSPEEVEAVLKSSDPNIVIKQDAINFKYSALGKRYQTESFPTYINGTIPGGNLSLSARFSYPPAPLKVIGIYRTHRQQVEPVPQALYVESLIEKYGSPTMDSGSTVSGQQVERILEWHIGGTTQCLTKGGEVSSTPPLLDRIKKDGRRLENPTPDFTDQCISMLRYSLRGDPVVQANGGMLDVSAGARAEFETQRWIQSLIDEKSRTGTEKPSL